MMQLDIHSNNENDWKGHICNIWTKPVTEEGHCELKKMC